VRQGNVGGVCEVSRTDVLIVLLIAAIIAVIDTIDQPIYTHTDTRDMLASVPDLHSHPTSNPSTHLQLGSLCKAIKLAFDLRRELARWRNNHSAKALGRRALERRDNRHRESQRLARACTATKEVMGESERTQ
jgi:hypothetical protein